MANTHKLFKAFDREIKLKKPKIKELEKNRKALREKIKRYFNDKGYGPPGFYPQGSLPLDTNLNPIKGSDYDLDDGVYFICPEDDRKSAHTYHSRIKDAVKEHTKETRDKNTCVRVIYHDGHHIDLPCYWLKKRGNIPQLAHKSEGYIESDPRSFENWVRKKISASNSNGQLKRSIRYLKAWKDYRENSISNLKLPSGFILTILACNNFSRYSDRDDIAFTRMVKSIHEQLTSEFTCKCPTVPRNKNLLDKYSEDNVLRQFRFLLNNAEKAKVSDCEKQASEYWRKVFGNRFPSGEER